MNQKKSFLIPLIFIVLLGCDGSEGLTFTDRIGNEDNLSYRPVYGEPEFKEIELTSPQAVKNPGKIYVYGKYLLVNEKGQGIHVFDNANPEAPSPVGFLRILGNSDLAMKDGKLYADHMGDLVAVNVQDFNLIEETGRLQLANWNLGVPPPARSYFECVDPSKGLVVAWKKSDKENLNCYATN
jgi:hypothetical protein